MVDRSGGETGRVAIRGKKSSEADFAVFPEYQERPNGACPEQHEEVVRDRADAEERGDGFELPNCSK